MHWFTRLSLSIKLSLLVAMCLAAFAGFAVKTKLTLDHLQVNGPVYQQIVQGKDVISDVLPPPEYIVESYLVVQLLLDENEPMKAVALVDRLRKLHQEYDQRHAVWVRELPEGELRQLMTVESYDPAVEFFRIAEGELVPAIQAGNRAAAEAVVRGKLAPVYERQRAAVDKIVALATRLNSDNEKYAADEASAATTMMFVFGLAVIAIIVLMGWLANRIARSLTERMNTAVTVATQVAAGDLTATIASQGTDESARLLDAIGAMTRSLHSLVSRVKKSSIELMSTASELSATSMQQETAAHGFGASTTEIAAAIKEINATSQELTTTVDSVNRVAASAADLAKTGQASLDDMDATMRQLGKATAAISGKLSVIREKAADIGAVVTTITKVADQTNLLSVNAAIEAEKAGEFGLGFLVLSREIRRLADQTAVATLDIDHMVKEMQGAVTSGVMEMDKFTEQVRQGVTSVAQVGTQLVEIVGQVQVMSDRFAVVNAGVRNQAAGARQINDAMINLQDSARQTSGALREFNSASEHLRNAVGGLRDEIAHFKVN